MIAAVRERVRSHDLATGEPVPGSQSVYRAVAVLRGVARSNINGITASVLANDLQLTLATTHRLLKVLTGEGLLTFDPYSKRYKLGLQLYTLGLEAQQFALRELLAGALQRIRDLSRETVFLFVRSGADSLCLERLDGDIAVPQLTIDVAARRPLGIGAGGLALLAAESDAFIEQALAHNANIYSAYADLTAEEIRVAMLATRRRGFSFNDGRLQDDVRAVGLAVGRTDEPPLAAVSIATSQARIGTRKRKEFESLLYNELKTRDWTFP